MEKIKVGDWVECCSLMPGLVQSIDGDNIETFQPHYKEEYPEYTGGSCCSIEHCGVFKITKEYADRLLAIGKQQLIQFWRESKTEEEYRKKIEEFKII